MKVSIASLQSFCISALEQPGLSTEDSQTTADALVTDAMGVFSIASGSCSEPGDSDSVHVAG